MVRCDANQCLICFLATACHMIAQEMDKALYIIAGRIMTDKISATYYTSSFS